MSENSAPILLVDDRPENLLSLEAVLEPLGQPLVRASSGMEALRKVLATDFAVILLDVNMPEMDGYETARLIKARNRSRHVPIIFITAAERASVNELYRLGAVDFLQKPFSPEVLIAKVSVFVELHLRGERLRAQEVVLLQQAQKQSDLERHRFAELLLGVVSHDLRAPLAAITAAVQLLDRRLKSPDEKKLTERALASGKRMERMIGQLLDLTRMRLGTGMVLQRTDVDLVELVRRVVAELAIAHPTRVVHVEGHQAVRGRWDADRLEQVVQNLVGNAFQHGAPGEPINIRFTSTADQASIAVHNMGSPIPVELRTSLFDPFRRGIDPRATTSDGLGLGLYIAQQIAVAHGGRIVVESDERGTEFRVELPVIEG
jgi:signal transduction histidine kinase